MKYFTKTGVLECLVQHTEITEALKILFQKTEVTYCCAMFGHFGSHLGTELSPSTQEFFAHSRCFSSRAFGTRSSMFAQGNSCRAGIRNRSRSFLCPGALPLRFPTEGGVCPCIC